MDIELVMLEVTHSDRAELEAVMRGAGYTVHKALGHSFPLAELLPSWVQRYLPCQDIIYRRVTH